MLNKDDELKIMRYLENNFILEYFKVSKGDGYIKIVDEKGKVLYFWVDSVGSIEYGDYPF